MLLSSVRPSPARLLNRASTPLGPTRRYRFPISVSRRRLLSERFWPKRPARCLAAALGMVTGRGRRHSKSCSKRTRKPSPGPDGNREYKARPKFLEEPIYSTNNLKVSWPVCSPWMRLLRRAGAALLAMTGIIALPVIARRFRRRSNLKETSCVATFTSGDLGDISPRAPNVAQSPTANHCELVAITR